MYVHEYRSIHKNNNDEKFQKKIIKIMRVCVCVRWMFLSMPYTIMSVILRNHTQLYKQV